MLIPLSVVAGRRRGDHERAGPGQRRASRRGPVVVPGQVVGPVRAGIEPDRVAAGREPADLVDPGRVGRGRGDRRSVRGAVDGHGDALQRVAGLGRVGHGPRDPAGRLELGVDARYDVRSHRDRRGVGEVRGTADRAVAVLRLDVLGGVRRQGEPDPVVARRQAAQRVGAVRCRDGRPDRVAAGVERRHVDALARTARSVGDRARDAAGGGGLEREVDRLVRGHLHVARGARGEPPGPVEYGHVVGPRSEALEAVGPAGRRARRVDEVAVGVEQRHIHPAQRVARRRPGDRADDLAADGEHGVDAGAVLAGERALIGVAVASDSCRS